MVRARWSSALASQLADWKPLGQILLGPPVERVAREFAVVLVSTRTLGKRAVVQLDPPAPGLERHAHRGRGPASAGSSGAKLSPGFGSSRLISPIMSCRSSASTPQRRISSAKSARASSGRLSSSARHRRVEPVAVRPAAGPGTRARSRAPTPVGSHAGLRADRRHGRSAGAQPRRQRPRRPRAGSRRRRRSRRGQRRDARVRRVAQHRQRPARARCSRRPLDGVSRSSNGRRSSSKARAGRAARARARSRPGGRAAAGARAGGPVACAPCAAGACRRRCRLGRRRLAVAALQERVLGDLLVDRAGQLEIRHLQQPDRLLQLRRQDRLCCCRSSRRMPGAKLMPCAPRG